MCLDDGRLVAGATVADREFSAGTIQPIPLEPMDEVSVTVLVDNSVDMLLPDEGPVRRTGLMSGKLPRVRVELMRGHAIDSLRAEHGFSVLVELTRHNSTCRVLFDAGLTPDGLVENMRRLDVAPKNVDVVVLSHGHLDHVTGLHGFIEAVGGSANMPVVLHPDVWLERRLMIPGHDPVELPTLSRRAIEEAGFEIIERPEPSFLLDGALLVTGEVARTTEFETGFLIHEAKRDGQWTPDPLIFDDQALIAHVRGKGLLVITGCGHAGVVNTVRYARQLTGIENVHAVMGGFHLTGKLFEPLIPQTVNALTDLHPDIIMPGHCSGWKATHRIAAELPDAFVANAVGTRVELTHAPE